MEQLIIAAMEQDDYDKVNQCLLNGWVLNPSICNGNPAFLRYITVYHLIKYTDDEIDNLPVEESSPHVQDIDSIISVDINDADENIAEGYQVFATYAKTVTLVKYKVQPISGVEPS